MITSLKEIRAAKIVCEVEVQNGRFSIQKKHLVDLF